MAKVSLSLDIAEDMIRCPSSCVSVMSSGVMDSGCSMVKVWVSVCSSASRSSCGIASSCCAVDEVEAVFVRVAGCRKS